MTPDGGLRHCRGPWLVILLWMAFLKILDVFGHLDGFGEATKSKKSNIGVRKDGIWQHFEFLGEIRIFRRSRIRGQRVASSSPRWT